MSTPPSSIEEVAKRVKELAEGTTEAPWSWASTGMKDNSWSVGTAYYTDDAERDDDDPLPPLEMISGEVDQCRDYAVDKGICESINGETLADAAFVAEVRTLAPQLAEWVEKALPAIEAAQEVLRKFAWRSHAWSPGWSCAECGAVRPNRPADYGMGHYANCKIAQLLALDTPSSLAEGTTE